MWHIPAEHFRHDMWLAEMLTADPVEEPPARPRGAAEFEAPACIFSAIMCAKVCD